MSRTLWGAGGELDRQMDNYTVGEDRVWDRRLLMWDLYGTLGHVEGLEAGGILGKGDRRRLVAALRRALRDARAGRLVVSDTDEDVHTAIENHLAEQLGPLGGKVHTGRSRNDQVIAALRLHMKDRLFSIWGGVLDVAQALASFAKDHQRVLWPGYTHQRRAMPSTIGLWAAGIAESLLDDLVPLRAALKLADRSPLGSAAGFGVPLPLDREATARALGFASVQHNVTSVQASRGKLEVVILSALWTIANDLGKFSWDVILLSSDEFGFLELPEGFATGSSIMPHKKNPDVFELTRAREGVMAGLLAQAIAVTGKLPSGYHRDLQMTKGPLMRGLDTILQMTGMIGVAVPGLTVNHDACAATVTGDLLATDEVYRLVREGAPFREAYRSVAAGIKSGEASFEDAAADVLASRRHAGGAGNLGLGKLGRTIRSERAKRDRVETAFRSALAALEGKTGK